MYQHILVQRINTIDVADNQVNKLITDASGYFMTDGYVSSDSVSLGNLYDAVGNSVVQMSNVSSGYVRVQTSGLSQMGKHTDLKFTQQMQLVKVWGQIVQM